jgi:hypothetical protein
MAQQRTVILIDDLDGSQAQHTVAFSLDGQQYEIDLSVQNSQRLHDALAPFISKARIAHPEPSVRRRAPRPVTAAQPEPQPQPQPQPRPEPEPRSEPRRVPPAAVTAPAVTAPAVTAPAVTAPAVTAPEETPVAAASRPPVPAALFSDSTEQVPTRAVTLKPQATELFSPAS